LRLLCVPYRAQMRKHLPFVYHIPSHFSVISQGKHAEAEPLFQRAIEIWEKVHGLEHPLVAKGLSNWAGVLKEQVRAASQIFSGILLPFTNCAGIIGEKSPPSPGLVNGPVETWMNHHVCSGV